MKKFTVFENLTYGYEIEAKDEDHAEEIFYGEAEGLVGKGYLCEGTEITIVEEE
jgi:hypothetical protein